MLQIGGVVFVLFADFLNLAMNQAGLTNYKLAKRLGISQTTVANWLDGTTEPRSKKRGDVLALFGVAEKDLESGQFEIIYCEDADQKEKPTLPEEGELSKERIQMLLDKMSAADLAELMADCAEAMRKKGLE